MISKDIQEQGYSPKQVDELLDKIIKDYKEMENNKGQFRGSKTKTHSKNLYYKGILRKFALDHQTKILTLAYIEDRGVADVYFKKINSSTDESVFK